MWQQHLINENFPTIYFNAWENDFTDDALVALIGEVSSSIKGDNSKLMKIGNEYQEIANKKTQHL